MKITQSGGQTERGPADWFTGDVYIDTVKNPDDQSAIGCAHVRFTPGARTAWHSHPKGQTLYVTDGIGLVSYRGGEVVEIRPGDVVYIEPGEEHWHGATPDRFMAHAAMQEADDQGQVVWSRSGCVIHSHRTSAGSSTLARADTKSLSTVLRPLSMTTGCSA